MKRWSVLVLAAPALVLALWSSDRSDRAVDAPSVSVFGPWLGGEADAFVASLRPFTERTGIEVRYTGSRDFVDDLRSRAASGIDAPDVALVPQPGLVVELLDAGALQPLGEAVLQALDRHHPDGRAVADIDGQPTLVPYRSSVKSLIWYRPAVWEQAGWQVPGTLDELRRLATTMAATGDVEPWCFTIFSGEDTGWPMTDWVEDLLLRRAGADVYDRFAAGRLPYTDPAVEDAFEAARALLLGPQRTTGGVRRIVKTAVPDAAAPLFTDPPGCAMYKQATFATAWFPDGTVVAPDGDVDFFVLPGIEPDEPPPLIRTADVAVQLGTRPIIERLMAYLATPDSARAWAERGGFVSERIAEATARFGVAADRRASALLQNAPVVRPDASDLLPADFRSALLAAVADWTAGQRPTAELLGDLEALRGE